MSGLGDFLQATGLSDVTVELRSAVAPPLTVRPASDPDAPSTVGPFLRPAVTVRDGAGHVLMSQAPYGEPPSWTGYAAPALVVLALVGIGFTLGRVLR